MNDIREVVNGEVVTESEEKPVIKERPEGMVAAPLDVDVQAVADVMGLEGKEKGKYKSEISTLIRWARTQTDEHNPVNLKWALRNLQMKLGTPPLAEKAITRAARFAYLDLEGKRLDKEKLSLMG